MAFELGPDGLYHIQLKPGDVRLGTFNADGSIKAWPRQTVFGVVVDRNVATLHGLDAQYFVVLPPNTEHQVEITLDAAQGVAAPAKRADKAADKPVEAA